MTLECTKPNDVSPAEHPCDCVRCRDYRDEFDIDRPTVGQQGLDDFGGDAGDE